jgi:hypothetical protein
MLKPVTYQAAARRLRKFADQIDARCTPKTPRQKAALTSAVYGLSRYGRQLAERHRRTTIDAPVETFPASLLPPFERKIKASRLASKRKNPKP